MTKLSERERLILGWLENRGASPIPEAAKALTMQIHAARYSLLQLQYKKIIGSKIAFVDPLRLGYSVHSIFISFSSTNRRTADQLLSYLHQSREIWWLAEIGAEYHYAMTVVHKSASDLNNFFVLLGQRFDGLIRDKSIAEVTKFTAFGKKYLLPTYQSANSLRMEIAQEVETIDAQDQRILEALTLSVWSSYRDVARALSLPAATLERRIAILQKKKIIQGFFYRVSTKALGVNAYKILIAARGISASLDKDLYEYCRKHPHIVNLISCLGTWDYDLRVEVFQSEDIVPIIKEISEQFGNQIASTKVIPQFASLKYSPAPPV